MCGDLLIVEAVLTKILNIPELPNVEYLESRLMAIIKREPVVIVIGVKPRHDFQRPVGAIHLARAELNIAATLVSDPTIKKYLTQLALVCFYWD